MLNIAPGKMTSTINESCGLRIIKRSGEQGRRFSFPARNFVVLGSHEDNDICIKAEGIEEFAAVVKNDNGKVILTAVNQQLTVPHSSVGILDKRQSYVLEDGDGFFIGERLFKLEITEKGKLASNSSNNSASQRGGSRGLRATSSRKKPADSAASIKKQGHRRTSLIVTEHHETEIQAPLPRVLPKEQDSLSAADICSVIERHSPVEKKVEGSQNVAKMKIGGMSLNLSYASEEGSESTNVEVTDSYSSDIQDMAAEVALSPKATLAAAKKGINNDSASSGDIAPSEAVHATPSVPESRQTPKSEASAKLLPPIHQAPSRKIESSVKKQLRRNTVTSSKMNKYDRMSNGMPATPLLTRAPNQFVRRKTNTLTGPKAVDAKAGTLSQVRPHSTTDGITTPVTQARRNASMKPTSLVSPHKESETFGPAPSPVQARKQDVSINRDIQPVRRSSFKKSAITPCKSSPSPRKKEVNFASRELEPGPHYTPRRNQQAPRRFNPEPKATPNMVPRPSSFPKPSPIYVDKPEDEVNQQENEPPNSKLAVLGKFYNVKPPTDELVRKNEDTTGALAESNGEPEKKESHESQPSSGISALWRRLSGGISNSPPSKPDLEEVTKKAALDLDWTDEKHDSSEDLPASLSEDKNSSSAEESLEVSTPTWESNELQGDGEELLKPTDSLDTLNSSSSNDYVSPEAPIRVEYEDSSQEESGSGLEDDDFSDETGSFSEDSESKEDLDISEDDAIMDHEIDCSGSSHSFDEDDVIEPGEKDDQDKPDSGSKRSSGRLSIAGKIAAAARTVTEKYLPAGHDFMRRLSGIPDSESEHDSDGQENGSSSQLPAVGEEMESSVSLDVSEMDEDQAPKQTESEAPHTISDEKVQLPSDEKEELSESDVPDLTANEILKTPDASYHGRVSEGVVQFDNGQEEGMLHSGPLATDAGSISTNVTGSVESPTTNEAEDALDVEANEESAVADKDDAAQTYVNNSLELNEIKESPIAKDRAEMDTKLDSKVNDKACSLLNEAVLSVAEVKACLGKFEEDVSGSKDVLVSRLSTRLSRCENVEDIMVLTMENMKSCLRGMELATIGNKAALAERLIEHMTRREVPAEIVEDAVVERNDKEEKEEEDETVALEKYRSLTVAQLRTLCASNDISTPAKWRKNDIIRALVERGVSYESITDSNGAAESEDVENKKSLRTPRSTRKTPRSSRVKRDVAAELHDDEVAAESAANESDIECGGLKTPTGAAVESKPAVRRSTRKRGAAGNNSVETEVEKSGKEERKSTRGRTKKQTESVKTGAVESNEGEVEVAEVTLVKQKEVERTRRGTSRARRGGGETEQKVRSGGGESMKAEGKGKSKAEGEGSAIAAVRRETRSKRTEGDQGGTGVRRSNRRKAI